MSDVEGCRKLIVVLGDQLDLDSVLPGDFDPDKDHLWMAETSGEANRAWSHKARLVMFLSAMRHFRDAVRDQGLRLCYRATEDHDAQSLAELLARDVTRMDPESVLLTRPGDYHVHQEIRAALNDVGAALEEREDPHFLTAPAQFEAWAKGRKSLRMEYFYREVRRRQEILVDADGEPEGGKWNYDAENRGSFGQEGPPDGIPVASFEPDSLTREVMALVEDRYGDHPGQLDHFDWPVTRADALLALDDFVEHRLARFGDYQDAIWVGAPYLYHSRLAAALNVHLLRPGEVVDAAVKAYREDRAPLNAVEGFVRQIIGWREYIRGIYWLRMPGWLDENVLDADQALPEFFWTGETDMACLADAIGQSLEYGYAHHIQRLMVTGLFCLLLGVRPREVHQWYHGIYVDAVEWVELPNTLGMSQFVDGGILASKPYVASGNYIQRMSNACGKCRFDPGQRSGEKACPYTTLYWDFLNRHRERFANHYRMRLQVRNLERIDDEEMDRIKARAHELRKAWHE